MKAGHVGKAELQDLIRWRMRESRLCGTIPQVSNVSDGLAGGDIHRDNEHRSRTMS